MGQYKFDRWGGDLGGSANPATLTMNTSKTVTAYFKVKTDLVSLHEAKNLIDGSQNLLVLDVSSASDYAQSHMLCAKNYVWNSGANNFSTSTTNLNNFKNHDILIYDQTGTKSLSAATYLAGQGFNLVSYMNDGLDDWMAQGYDVFASGQDSAGCTSLAPMAYAGDDQNVNENSIVTLRGQGSDPDGGAVSFLWDQVEGATVSLSNHKTAQPTFQAPDLNGGNDRLVFHLTVTDNQGDKDTDSVTVSVSWNNAKPNADAGLDQTVTFGQKVTLDGSGSTDPEGSMVSYQWNASGGVGTFPATLSGVTPSFTAPSKEGWVIYTLTVTDNGSESDTDYVKITVIPGTNDSPRADAGDNQNVTEGATVFLDSSGSTDTDGNIVNRQWTQTAGPDVTFNASAVKPTFKAPEVSDATMLTFALTVTDDDGATDTATVTVTVNDSGSAQEDPPTAPTGVTANASADGIEVSWNVSTGADSYMIFRSEMPAWTGATPKQIAASITGLSYSDTNAQAGTRYYYWVKARNADGVSKFSMFTTGYRGDFGTKPPVPNNVEASEGEGNGVTIAWAESSGTLVYEIYRATIPAYLDFNLDKIATVSETFYEDSNVQEGTLYYYWVKARNSWGISRFSKFATGYVGTPSVPPAAPTDVVATDGTVSGKVSVSWEASLSGGIAGYEIWQATKLVSEGGNPIRIGYVTGTAFEDTKGSCGNTYYYWVKARNSWGASGYSRFDTGFCN